MWVWFYVQCDSCLKSKSLTIVPVKTSPDKLVVVSDLVYYCSKTAYTMLHNLRRGKTNKFRALKNKCIGFETGIFGYTLPIMTEHKSTGKKYITFMPPSFIAI